MRWDHAQTPYQILGLDMGATADEIAIAYKRLIVEVHPDRDSSAVALTRFKRIRDAFELLADSSRRSEYDQEFRRHHAGTTGLPSVFVYVRKKRRDREIALEDASWKHELMSASQFDLILKLQKQVNGINSVEIKWNLLFADAHRVEPSKGNAALLIDYLLDFEAIGRQYGSRWEQLESDGISDFETLDLEHPRLSGSPFYLAGYSIEDRYFREVFDHFKAPHIAEAQRIAKLAADRDLLRTVFPTIRTVCLSLPEVKEVETEFGWTFSAGHKVFEETQTVSGTEYAILIDEKRRSSLFLATNLAST